MTNAISKKINLKLHENNYIGKKNYLTQNIKIITLCKNDTNYKRKNENSNLKKIIKCSINTNIE